jgi:hypothetical protein
VEQIGKQLNKYQVPNGNLDDNTFKKLPVAAVDKVADELVAEYNNQVYRRWYCGVIYEFGFSKVHEWRRCASEGREPAKLFSKYVKDARTYRSIKTGSGDNDEA